MTTILNSIALLLSHDMITGLVKVGQLNVSGIRAIGLLLLAQRSCHQGSIMSSLEIDFRT